MKKKLFCQVKYQAGKETLWCGFRGAGYGRYG